MNNLKYRVYYCPDDWDEAFLKSEHDTRAEAWQAVQTLKDNSYRAFFILVEKT